MRALRHDQAEAYLSTIGMKIGAWNQLIDIDERRHKSRRWAHKRSPEDVHKSYTFSQHIAGWAPPGNWKLLQIDNSTSLNPAQLALVQCLLFGPEWAGDLNFKRSFLFEFTGDVELDSTLELIICNLVFAFLSFDAHAQLVSSTSHDGRYASMQDGFAYLMSVNDESAAKSLMEQFDRTGGTSPEWVGEITARRQERALGRDQVPDTDL